MLGGLHFSSTDPKSLFCLVMYKPMFIEKFRSSKVGSFFWQVFDANDCEFDMIIAKECYFQCLYFALIIHVDL